MNSLNLLSDDPREIEESIINAYNAMQVEIGESELMPADPRYIFLKALAYIFSTYSTLINEKMKQNFIDYAEKENLDALGKLTGTVRLKATPALCFLKFTRVQGTTNKVLIPAGTRVTSDSVVYFKTAENAEILEGNQSVKVRAEAIECGTLGNGYGIGSITQIVDSIAYIKSVENITQTNGGTDIESDDNYRSRIFLAPETFSTAGPKLAYAYHSKTVSSDIIDIAVVSSSPGEVEIYPLMKNGELPSEEILQEIEKKLSADEIRPLTDKVKVLEPIKKEYKIDLDYYLYEEREAILDETIQNIVAKFIAWEKSALGRDINPDKLIADLQNAGIKRVVIREPVFSKVESFELAYCISSSVTFKGLEVE